MSYQLSNVFVDFNAQRLQELQILIIDFEGGIGSERGYEGGLVVRFLALLADADGSFEDQEDVVAALFDARHDLGNGIGIGQRLVDRFAQFFHQLFELLVHRVPLEGASVTRGCDRAPRVADIVTPNIDKIDQWQASL